jgi:hypothetical protein
VGRRRPVAYAFDIGFADDRARHHDGLQRSRQNVRNVSIIVRFCRFICW